MRKLLFLFLGFLSTTSASAQVAATLAQYEARFLSNNLQLLASQYNITAARAAVIQARIWDQPLLSGEINAVNPQDNRVFDAGRSGQKALAVQQLLYLGGKKKKEVEFARGNVALAELDYEQLLWQLRYEIRQRFYELYFNQQKVRILNRQLGSLDTLLTAYTTQNQKGNVALKDLVRLRSLELSFKNNLLDIQKDALAQEQTLQVLTGNEEQQIAEAAESYLTVQYGKTIPYTAAQLQEKALLQNPEYLIANTLVSNDELYLCWQQSLAVPDLTLGAAYDQRGGAFNNQVNLTFGIPVPLWNRNRGNIAAARARIGESSSLAQQKRLEIGARIAAALKTFRYQQAQLQQTLRSRADFETVYAGVLQNFQRGNLSLIEFTDFMESYNESTLFLAEIQKQFFLSGETLNYLTNEQVF